jgi:TetR/AcrR family transcriptional repressor of mexJK operon
VTLRSWPADHPKAKLMKRKREAILAAARRQFLAHGYGGTSMEAIADAAGVSIMTLYRHAETKDELFEAVISIACDPEEELTDLSAMSLRDILIGSAAAFQEKLLGAETMALLRAVISEQDRFPDLAAVAYRAVIGHLEEMIAGLLAKVAEGKRVSAPERKRLAAAFSDRLFGADVFRILMGLGKRSAADQKQRAEQAAEELLAALP